MATAGKISGLVFQALRFIGQENINDKVIGILKRKLAEKDKQILMADLRFAPAWMEKIIKKLEQRILDRRHMRESNIIFYNSPQGNVQIEVVYNAETFGLLRRKWRSFLV